MNPQLDFWLNLLSLLALSLGIVVALLAITIWLVRQSNDS